MKRLITLLVGFACLFPQFSQAGDDGVLEVSENTLNELVTHLGMLSSSGDYQAHYMAPSMPGITICEPMGFVECPGLGGEFGSIAGASGIPLVACQNKGGGSVILPGGKHVHWQWWVTDAHFTLHNGDMTFTATLRYQLGGKVDITTSTVPAHVSFDNSSNRLVIHIDDFLVHILDSDNRTATTVDLAKLYTLSFLALPQTITVPTLQGGSKTTTGRIQSISPEYLNGKIRIKVQVGF